jgi:hypothetical protein
MERSNMISRGKIEGIRVHTGMAGRHHAFERHDWADKAQLAIASELIDDCAGRQGSSQWQIPYRLTLSCHAVNSSPYVPIASVTFTSSLSHLMFPEAPARDAGGK